MRLIARADRIWMDAGPFFRFCEAGELPALAKYVGSRGCWVVDVANEIELRAASPVAGLRTHPGLQNLTRLGFPADQRGAVLEPDVNLEVATIRSAWAEPGEHPKKHRGEIATVLHAASLGGELVLVDDGDGIALARIRGVPHLSTTHLVAEMVVSDKLDADIGKEIFLSVRRARPLTQANWSNALARCRAALVE